MARGAVLQARAATPVLRRRVAAPLLATVAACVLATGGLSALPQDFFLPAAQKPTAEGAAVALAGSTLSVPSDGAASAVSRQAVTEVKVPWKGSSKFKSYDGFVYRRKRIPGVRLRMDRYGTSHWPFYRIRAAFQKSTKARSGRLLEVLGFWDPMKEVSDPRFFKLKLDRCVFWLRQGAQPTDMVANLLDRAGIIRRTGPLAKMGEWEWRIPKNSGPEAPEGWSYRGPHELTWSNRPQIRHRKGHPHDCKKVEKIPLIERYGFKGYEKLPIEGDILTKPVDGSFLAQQFDNTDIPM